MALGVIKIIPASNHTEVSLTGGGTAGGGQPYPTIKVLNPNDGVVYVAQNRDALGTGYGSWDWKVPSQSYAMLPGPFQSVGLYYLDQSGAGRQGEITIYSSQQKLDDPHFSSIGRALQAQTTSLDITEGTQPANPGVGITRIWSDTNGNIFRLLNTGANAELLDTSNYGALIGTLTTAVLFTNGLHVQSGFGAFDGSITVGTGPFGSTGVIRAPNGVNFVWRNFSNTSDISIGVTNGDNFDFENVAVAGTAGALVGYWQVVINGSVRKIALQAV